MNIEQAKQLLASATREECRDHAFGDCEVYWMKGEEEVASGYFGVDVAEVMIGETPFEGMLAEQLRHVGIKGPIERNDSTGPDEYQEGECMPALTREGILRELTEAPEDDADSPPTCQRRQLLDTDEDFPTGPVCGKPATHRVCDPVGAYACAEHRCRCNIELKPAGESARQDTGGT